MWWGDEHAKDEGRVNSVMIQDTTSKTPACQTSKTTTYPFTDLVFTENVMTLDQSGREEWGVLSGARRNVQVVLSEDGTATSRTISLPFRIVSMIGVQKAEDSDALTGSLDNIKNNLTVDDKQDASDLTVFRTLFCVSGGNMSSDDNVTGVYPEYGNTEDMAFVNGYSNAAETQDLDSLSNPLNVYKMLKGTYMDGVKEKGRNTMAGKKARSFNMDLGGYMEADTAYNSQTKSWECRSSTAASM